MDFKDRLRHLREEKGLTQKDCAIALSVDYSKYNKWENGSNPNFNTLIKIARYFNVSTDYLLGIVSENYGESGLSEKAKAVLEKMGQNHSDDFYISLSGDEYYSKKDLMIKYDCLDFINDLLEDAKTLFIVSSMIDEILYADDNGLSETQKRKINGGRLMACQEALFELINKIRGVEEGTDNQKKMPCTESPIINKRR